jgi:hypothetical protein
MRFELSHPFRVGYKLSWRSRYPGLPKSSETHFDLVWWGLLAIRNSKACPGIIALHCKVGVKVLVVKSDIRVYDLRGARTFRGSKSGSISEYPVANAIERREESDLARCSAMVSVGNMKKNKCR